MRTARIVGTTILFTVVWLAPAGTKAQASSAAKIGFAGGLALTYDNLTGGDFDGTKAGAGFDINAGITWKAWQLALGYDRTNHGHEDSDGDFVISNIYLEPRYLFFADARRWTPYAVARVGRAMASFDESFGGTSDADGWIYGVGAGLLWPLSGIVQVDVAAHYARVSHDYGDGDYSESEKGNRLGMRAGVRLTRSSK